MPQVKNQPAMVFEKTNSCIFTEWRNSPVVWSSVWSGVVWLLVAFTSLCTKAFLFSCWSWGNLEFEPCFTDDRIFVVGLFYDTVVVFSAFLLRCFAGWWKTLLPQNAGTDPAFISLSSHWYLLSGAEIVFWDEFNVRFNFIAVDYPIYTTEVLGNIWESHNIPLLAGGFVVVTCLPLVGEQERIIASQVPVMRLQSYPYSFCIHACSIGCLFPEQRFKNFSDNNCVNELGGKRFYEFGGLSGIMIDYTRFMQ